MRATLILAALLLVACGPGEARWPEGPPPLAPLPAERRIDLAQRWTVLAPGQTTSARLLVTLPRSLPRRQEVLALRFVGPPPTRTFARDGTAHAEWSLGAVQGSVEVGIDAEILVHRFDVSTLAPSPPPEDPATLSRYRRAERFLEVDDPEVQAEAATVPATPGDDLALVLGLYRHVLRRLHQGGYNTASTGAAATLRAGTGDCTDYTDLLVALARARGLPARHVTGLVLASPGVIPHHSWAELYTRSHGWVPLDPFLGALGKASPERRAPAYVQLYDNRNEEVGDLYRYWWTGDRVRVAYSVTLNGVRYQDFGKP